MIKAGDDVVITDACGYEHPAKALGSVEPGHKFPIVWVLVSSTAGTATDRVPWPADSVRALLPTEETAE